MDVWKQCGPNSDAASNQGLAGNNYNINRRTLNESMKSLLYVNGTTATALKIIFL